MQKILQNFAQKNTENLLNEKKPAKLCGKFFKKINGKSLNLLTRPTIRDFKGGGSPGTLTFSEKIYLPADT